MIEAATRAGVEHVVYTSSSNPERWQASFRHENAETEEALAASGLGWTVLRNNIFTDHLVPRVSRAIATGELEAAAGGGGAGYVTRDDCAAAAAAALASPEFDGRTINVTGPAVVTQADLARIASAISRSRVAYAPRSPEELRKRLIAAGMSRDRAEVLVSLDEAVANGWFQTATDAVQELTGKPPTSVLDFLTGQSDVLFRSAEPAFAGVTPPVGSARGLTAPVG